MHYIAGGFLLMKLKKWELALIFALVITFLCGAALSKEQQDLSDKLIRLHVVANSDSEADQALKLHVRDRILAEITPLLNGVTDRSAAAQLIEKRLESLIAASQEIIRKQGYSYEVTAEIAVEEFPTRDYDTFSLPAGKYTSLRVVIGEGGGHNWWCVIFPPFCMTAATDYKETFKLLTDEQIKLITSDEPEYVIKFKSIEWFNKIRAWLGL
jgi:stage II sporulation protein R